MEILKIVLNWAIPFLCAGGFAFIIKQLKFNKAMKDSMLSLVYSNLTNKCETYLREGYLTEQGRYCLEELFKNYKVLGGNHGMETLVNQCYNLPPVKIVKSSKK